MKTTGDSGGYGMLMGPFATRQEIDEFRSRVRQNPANYIAQPLVQLSAHATYTDGRFEPRRIDLRPFILYGDKIRVLPGGLTRVALRPGSFVVELVAGRRQQGHLGARAPRALMNLAELMNRAHVGVGWPRSSKRGASLLFLRNRRSTPT